MVVELSSTEVRRTFTLKRLSTDYNVRFDCHEYPLYKCECGVLVIDKLEHARYSHGSADPIVENELMEKHQVKRELRAKGGLSKRK